MKEIIKKFLFGERIKGESMNKYIPEGNQIAVYALLEQAKAMHREEIEIAWLEGFYDMDTNIENSQQYYNETFNNGEKTK